MKKIGRGRKRVGKWRDKLTTNWGSEYDCGIVAAASVFDSFAEIVNCMRPLKNRHRRLSCFLSLRLTFKEEKKITGV